MSSRPQRSKRFFLGLMLLCLAVPGLAASEPLLIITDYEAHDYVRHPRMEEEDRLRGGNPAYRPGLEIICNIDDVEIRFFGEKVGRTPAEWDGLAPGSYHVRMERSGYAPVEFRVAVRSDRRTVVVVTITEPFGTLELHDLPPDAVVTVDRIPQEGRRIPVPAGLHSLRVRAFGYHDLQETVRITSGEELEWYYTGAPAPFALQAPDIRPRSLPGDDRRGFRIAWEASAPGDAAMHIIGPSGDIEDIIPLEITRSTGTVFWRPKPRGGMAPDRGTYVVRFIGTGSDGRESVGESSLEIDNRFVRSARPISHALPGLMYAPGTAMLPPGIWQAATGAGLDIGSAPDGAYDGVPVLVGFRVAPAPRWELSGRFGLRARDPFDTTSVLFSLAGSWRTTPGSGPFSTNLALSYRHEGLSARFGRMPTDNPAPTLPGLQLSVPMEYAWDAWSVILAPSGQLAFLGTPGDTWDLATPARLTGTLSAGIYYEAGTYLVGTSMAVRTPDSGGSMLDWTLWNGLEARFDLPGDASYFSGFCGVRSLDDAPTVSMGVEFGVIH